MDRAIEIEGLTKNYGAVKAVDGLGLSVERGTIHGFLGPNGAGKTTTLKILVGLLRADSGRIRVLGQDLGADSRAIRSRVGYMPETPRFPTYLAGRELLDFYGRMYRVSEEARDQAVASVLEMVGLADRQDDRIASYSKGMQQRVGLAQALLPHPDLVILDEPSTGLDPLGMAEFRGLIGRLRDEQGITVFLSSHLLNEVQQLCDHVTIVNRGKRVASGTIQEISRELVGESILEVEINRVGEDVIHAIRSLGFVDGVETNGTKVIVSLNTNDDVRSQISRAIVESGGTILSMQIARRSLEDAFIRLVQLDNGKSQKEDAS